MTIEELKNFLQKLVNEGKGDYQIRSCEFENHIPTIKYFEGIDDENKELWYSA